MAIHPTAIVHPDAVLHDSVEVGPHCIIDAHVRVDAGCRLYQGVYLTGWTHIGQDCVLHPHVIVGHEPQDASYGGERTYCRIGRGTVLREFVTVHRGTDPESETVVGEDCFVLCGSHIAHNCRIGHHVTIINNVLLAGHIHVGDRAVLGGAVGIHQFVRVGELAMIAGTARVVMDVVPFALVDAVGKITGLNRIGMRRADMPRDEIQDIRNAYQLLFSGRLPFSKAVEEACRQLVTPAGKRLVSFLRADTKRGLAGGRKSGRGATSSG